VSFRLGLELTALESNHRTRGIGRVAQAYLEKLSELNDVELIPYTKGDFPTAEPNGAEDWSQQLFDPLKVSWFIRKENPDLLHIIDPMKVPSIFGCPVVTMVQDLIPYLYSERYQTNLWSRFLHWRMKRQILRSNLIVTPSACTSDDLSMLFDVDEDRVRCIYHGIDHDRFYPRDRDAVESVLDRYDVRKPYFLMVADLRHFDPRKKLGEVIEAWDHERLSDVNLVIVGKRGEYSKRLRSTWSGRDSDLIFPGFINDDELACFYSGARLLIFPSRYEGFGFPVIESMACGTMPVVKGVGSVEEIAGNEAIVLEENTFSEQLTEVLDEYINHSPSEESCVKHAAQFTWDRAIGQLKQAYESILGTSPWEPSKMSEGV